MSKTPNFDKSLNEILKELQPHQKNCKECGKNFNIFQEDINFYKKINVPPPTLCPDCRMQRRLGWRINFLPIFYKKTCSAPGHSEKIISLYSEENPIKVYDDKYYLSDEWDALEFGIDYDFNKSFFKQFKELVLSVPHQSLQKDPQSINCDYVVAGISSKNCYYVAVPYFSENIYYAFMPVYSKDCIDVNDTDHSEQCYEGVYLNHCYNCNFCYNCSNCLDSYFLYDCQNCRNCFGCTNLRNKQYYFFNQPLTKEEYHKKLKEIDLGRRSVVEKYQLEFEKLLSEAIRKNLNNIKAEKSIGNDLIECRNCFYVFRLLSGECENLRYTAYVAKFNDTMDCFGGTNSFLVYESTGIAYGSNIKFSSVIRTGLELEYCIETINCQNCFGCFGLKNKKFCIFNKQYSEGEYWQLVDKIKTQMLKDGEYGEFFPLSMSPFPYNDSNASIEFPLSKEEIIKKDWHWQEDVKKEIDLSKFKVLKAQEVPDNIKEVSDDILKTAIICEQTGKPFNITKFELNFYRNKNLPIPVVHPLQRIRNRFKFRHPFKLWQHHCSRCNELIYSGWDPEKKYKVYCEKCYQQEVI